MPNILINYGGLRAERPTLKFVLSETEFDDVCTKGKNFVIVRPKNPREANAKAGDTVIFREMSQIKEGWGKKVKIKYGPSGRTMTRKVCFVEVGTGTMLEQGCLCLGLSNH